MNDWIKRCTLVVVAGVILCSALVAGCGSGETESMPDKDAQGKLDAPPSPPPATPK